MTTTKTQKCPLCCSSDIDYQVIAHIKSKHAICPKCGEFVISFAAEQRLKDFDASMLDRMSQEARKTTDVRFIYFVECLSPPKKDRLSFSDNASPSQEVCTLQSSPVERSRVLM